MKLRGSNKNNLEAVAEMLELALKSAENETQLRGFVKVVIDSCREWATEFDNPKKKKPYSSLKHKK